jgi:hypothetical protein
MVNVGMSEYMEDQYAFFKKFHDDSGNKTMVHIVPSDESKWDKCLWSYGYMFFFWLQYLHQYKEIKRELIWDAESKKWLLQVEMKKRALHIPFIDKKHFKIIPGITRND